MKHDPPVTTTYAVIRSRPADRFVGAYLGLDASTLVVFEQARRFESITIAREVAKESNVIDPEIIRVEITLTTFPLEPEIWF